MPHVCEYLDFVVAGVSNAVKIEIQFYNMSGDLEHLTVFTQILQSSSECENKKLWTKKNKGFLLL